MEYWSCIASLYHLGPRLEYGGLTACGPEAHSQSDRSVQRADTIHTVYDWPDLKRREEKGDERQKKVL